MVFLAAAFLAAFFGSSCTSAGSPRAVFAFCTEALREDPGLTADDVHARLGYPRWAAARALHTARTQPSQQTGKAAGPEAP
jgi:hypothetical protein